MLVYAISITGYLLVISQLMLRVPFLYKTFAPFNLLIPPLGYLYIRSVVQNERRISWNDFFHFIPFLIFVGSYTPFYLMPTGEKRGMVDAVVHNFTQNFKSQDGIIPEWGYYLARFVQAICYVYFQWSLIKKAAKQEIVQFAIPHKKAVIKWLKFFTFMPMLSMLGIVVIFLFAMNAKTNAQVGTSNIYSIIVSLSIFSFSVYLLFNPQLLYGISVFKISDSNSSKAIKIENESSVKKMGDQFDQDIFLIEQAMQKDQIFLTPNLSINLLSVNLGIPARDLSFIINNHYKLRFNDFINRHRIQYIVDAIDHGWLDQYTLESLSNKAGFVNKATFNAAFKKHIGSTPSEYVQFKANITA